MVNKILGCNDQSSDAQEPSTEMSSLAGLNPKMSSVNDLTKLLYGFGQPNGLSTELNLDTPMIPSYNLPSLSLGNE